jgi:hypothetical protein
MVPADDEADYSNDVYLLEKAASQDKAVSQASQDKAASQDDAALLYEAASQNKLRLPHMMKLPPKMRLLTICGCLIRCPIKSGVSKEKVNLLLEADSQQKIA